MRVRAGRRAHLAAPDRHARRASRRPAASPPASRSGCSPTRRDACTRRGVRVVERRRRGAGLRARPGPRRRRHVPARRRARPPGRRPDARGQPRPRRVPRRGRTAGRCDDAVDGHRRPALHRRGAGHRRRRRHPRRRRSPRRRGRSTRPRSSGRTASGCSRSRSPSTSGRCCASAATACCAPRRPARPPTPSPPAARSCGPTSTRCSSCPTPRTRCSPGRSSWRRPRSSTSTWSAPSHDGRAQLRRPPVVAVPPGARVRMRRGALPVKIVRLGDVSFTDRLVSKFQLPVRSLREASPPPRRRLIGDRDRDRESRRIASPERRCRAPARLPVPCATGVLDELRIRGLGVIDEAVLPLGPGLTVVTGETGAGKTMVVTGLLLLFGGRADPARVRTGAEQASVDGRLRVGAERRRRHAGPRRRRRARRRRRRWCCAGWSARPAARAPSSAARRAPVAVLAELADHLLAVHGQSDQLRLVRPAAQRAALDRYAGVDLAAVRRRLRALARGRGDRAGRPHRPGRRAAPRDRPARARSRRDRGRRARSPARPTELSRARRPARRTPTPSTPRPRDRARRAARRRRTTRPATPPTSRQLLGAAARALGQQHGDGPRARRARRAGSPSSRRWPPTSAPSSARYADGLDADPAAARAGRGRRAALGTAASASTATSRTRASTASCAGPSAARARLAEIDVSDEAHRRAAGRPRRRRGRGRGSSPRRCRPRAQPGGRPSSAAAVTAELAGLAMPDAAARGRR